MLAMNTKVQYSKSKKEKNSANIAVEVLTKHNYTKMEEEILTAIRGIENLLTILAPKPFLIQIDCKGILDLVKKNSSNMQA